jgi:hypothetical protein
MYRDEVSGQLDTPADLSPGKKQYPLDKRLNEAQDRSGRCGKKNLAPPGTRPLAPRQSSS